MILYGIYFSTGLALLIISGGLAYRRYLQQKLRSETAIPTPNGIESLEQIELNDSKQWLLIRGHDQANPVLLFLHGGPGSTELPAARYFGLELEKHVTVVHWDQRASGKSRNSDPNLNDLSISTYLHDAIALTHHLRERFQQEKIFLLGHSWGSMLGIQLILNHPELFKAYVGLGQSVDISRAEEYSHKWVCQQASREGNEKALAQLNQISPPYGVDVSEVFVQRKWLNHYGGSIEQDAAGVTKMYLTSPEYSLSDVLRLQSSADRLLKHLWHEMIEIDLIAEASVVDVPVFFFAGCNDHHTPSSLVQEYFDNLMAPSKKLFWFENSGHAPNFAEPERFQQILIDHVLAP